jgi:helicase
VVRLWLSGASFVRLAGDANLPIDDILGVHTRVLSYALQTIIEQAVALLEKLLQAQGQATTPVVLQFTEHLRFGVPTTAGCTLAAGGIRHRRAFVAIGNAHELQGFSFNDRVGVFAAAQNLIERDREGWQIRLGALVFENTLHDLSAVTRI